MKEEIICNLFKNNKITLKEMLILLNVEPVKKQKENLWNSWEISSHLDAYQTDYKLVLIQSHD